MIQRAQIRRYVRKVAQAFQPARVVLFGSYANGSATEDSDVDLLVIMDHDKRRNVEQAIDIQLKIAAPFPLDLLVRRPADIAERLAMNDTFVKTLVKDGQVLYG